MVFVRTCLLALAVVAAVSCAEGTVEPSVSFDDLGCSSSMVDMWPSTGAIEIDVSNHSDVRSAVVMGTYADGFGHTDLLAYGPDVSTRPDFIDSLVVHQVAPGVTSTLIFDHAPGTYFMVCMPDTNTMIVLDDLTISG